MTEIDYTKVKAAFEADVSAKSQRLQQQELQNAFIRALVLRNVPVSFAKGRIIENSEQIEGMVAEAESEYFAGQ